MLGSAFRNTAEVYSDAISLAVYESWFCVVSYLLLKIAFSFLVCLYNAYLGSFFYCC